MASKQLDTVVIGAGPGGYVSAIRAAQRGQDVTIIESTWFGGTCLNVGCIPAKALITATEKFDEINNSLDTFGISVGNVELDWGKTQEFKDGVVNQMTSGVEFLLKKNKVNIIEGTATFKDSKTISVDVDGDVTDYAFNNAIIAVGGHPDNVDGFELGGRVIDTTAALNIESAPESVVVINAGFVAVQLAQVLSRIGVKVTVLQKDSQILPDFDKDQIRLVTKRLEELNGEVITGVEYVGAEESDDSITVNYKVKGEEKSVTATYALLTGNRKPSTANLGVEAAGIELGEEGHIIVNEKGQTNVEGVYAIGDVTPGQPLAHRASHEGKRVAEIIAGDDITVESDSIQTVAVTDPEVATVGHNKSSAKDAGISAKATKFSYGANGRAVSMDGAEGFVRIVTDKDTNTVIGGQAVGLGADFLISELALAVDNELSAEDLALTIHAHPTLSEMVMDAAESALGQGIHG